MTHLTTGLARRALHSKGMSLVTAIFLLVVLAGMSVAMMSLSTTQQASSSLDILGSRAYQVARAGVEWGLFQQKQAGAACALTPGTTNSFAMPAGTTLSAFTVTVTCISTVTSGITRRQLTATACNDPTGGACPNPSNNPNYVQRVVQVEF